MPGGSRERASTAGSGTVRAAGPPPRCPGLAATGKVVRTRGIDAGVSTEVAYRLPSVPLCAERFAGVARAR